MPEYFLEQIGYKSIRQKAVKTTATFVVNDHILSSGITPNKSLPRIGVSLYGGEKK